MLDSIANDQLIKKIHVFHGYITGRTLGFHSMAIQETQATHLLEGLWLWEIIGEYRVVDLIQLIESVRQRILKILTITFLVR